MAKFSKRSLGNLEGIHPKLSQVMLEAIKDTPVDFTIVEGVRTLERQKALYAQGPTVTKCDGVVKKSNHQVKEDGYGYAVDLYPYYDGVVQIAHKDVPEKQLEIANHIKATAKRLGVSIVWGGDWESPYDPPHFELKI